jgi:hypothetical protein
VDITIQQGKTFSLVARYAAEPAVFKAITAITQGAPATVTATGHGIPEGWAAAIVGIAKGMLEINAQADPPRAVDYHQVHVIDPNTISFEDIDSSAYTAYKSGGYVRYYTPVDLTGATATMTVRDRIGGTVLLLVNAAIDNTAKTITITADPSITGTLDFDSALYELVVVIGAQKTTLLRGNARLERSIA